MLKGRPLQPPSDALYYAEEETVASLTPSTPSYALYCAVRV